MNFEPQWAYLDKVALPDQEHETDDESTPIGRRELQRDDWCDHLARLVPSDWRYSFEHDVLKTWGWLCPDAPKPNAWTTWLLSNGGIYAGPKSLATICVRTPSVGIMTAVTADTAGFIATILSVSWRHSMFPDGVGGRRLDTLTRKLLEFGRAHPEALAISAAID